MKLVVVCVGKTRERFVKEGIDKYLKYLRPFADVEIKELKEEKVRDLKDAPLVRKKEAGRIAKSIQSGAYVVAVDEKGREFTSHEFAGFLNRLRESGIREAAFVIGGAMGLDESVTGKAGMVLAMSRWTLTHEMARLALLEQLYRAFTIITGKTYHY